MEASKTADFYGCQKGNTIEVADAEQAYVQADMQGTPTWISLPWEEIPIQYRHMQKPVFRLRKALYGHPDAGTLWEDKVDAHMKKVGFIGLNPEWPSCYYHPKLEVYCVIWWSPICPRCRDHIMGGPPGSPCQTLFIKLINSFVLIP